MTGRRFKGRITSAHVLAIIAIVLALGGNALAFTLGKNSVGTKQLKKNAVTTAKIKNGAVTGAKIQASTLGTVPNAIHADSADSASTASVASSLPPAELWHSVGSSGEPGFQHGCHNASLPDIPNVRFYKDEVDVVHLEGVYDGCSPEGENAFQLPAGYRPRPNLTFSLTLFGEQGAVIVHGGAPVIPATEAGAVECPVSLCVLDGITFRAES